MDRTLGALEDVAVATRGHASGILGEQRKFSLDSSFHITDVWWANYLRWKEKGEVNMWSKTPKAVPLDGLMREKRKKASSVIFSNQRDIYYSCKIIKKP